MSQQGTKNTRYHKRGSQFSKSELKEKVESKKEAV